MLQAPRPASGRCPGRACPSVAPVGDLVGVEAVEAQQPVGLIQPVFAHQRRLDQRQRRGRIGDRARRPSNRRAAADSRHRAASRSSGSSRRRRIGADDHLRRLPGRREARRASLPVCVSSLARLLDPSRDLRHGACGSSRGVFSGAKRASAGVGRQFDIDRQPVGIEPGLRDQLRRGVGNGLEVDVAAEAMILAQGPRDARPCCSIVWSGERMMPEDRNSPSM